MKKNASYPYDSININGRYVEISSILLGIVSTESEFEKSIFNFIQAWENNVGSFVIETSGSTGAPKKIVITRKQMEQSARLTIQALKLQENETALVCLNPNYIAGKMMLVRALVGKMKIIALEPSANPLLHLHDSIDFIALVPLQLQAIINSATSVEKINYAKAIIVGGAAISASLQSTLHSIKPPIYATYGMTETISHIALQRLNGLPIQSEYKILPGIAIETDDRECLVIHAPYIQEKIYTNDLVKITGNNTFQWLGRYDNVINTGGIKIISEEIEAAIHKITTSFHVNQNFFICGLPDELYGEKIILIVEGDINENWPNILHQLGQSISKYALPKGILSLKRFIYTKNEKINRKALIPAIMAQYFTNK